MLGELIRSDAFASIRRGRYGAMVYPTVLALAFVALLVALLVTGALRQTRDAAPGPGGWAHLAEGLGAIVLFIVLLRPAGFLLTAGGLLALLSWRLGVRPWRAVALAAVVVPATWLLFGVLLRVDLPRGPLGW